MANGRNIEAIEGLLTAYKEALKGLSWVSEEIKAKIYLADLPSQHHLWVCTSNSLLNVGRLVKDGAYEISYTSEAGEEEGGWRRQRLVVALSEQGFHIARVVIGVGTPGILRADWQNGTITPAKSDIFNIPCLGFQMRDSPLRRDGLRENYEEGIGYTRRFLEKLQNPDKVLL